MKGTITTIQRMSVHDGPGIRSTVFLKGCNFRCQWCHNPETWRQRAQLQQVASRCISCGDCISVCVQKALSFSESAINITRSLCTDCGQCVAVCPSGALSIIGREVEASELINELLIDKPYYDESKGGVTLSGGEPLLQAQFCKKLLSLCKGHRVNTAMESNLSVPTDVLVSIADNVDLWMVDLKQLDDHVHQVQTRSSNRQTLKNLEWLSKNGADVLVRTPIIPGVNDREDAVEDICKYLISIGISRYEILPFHTFGFDKFAQLGMTNLLADAKPLPKERLEELSRVVRRYKFEK